jgi:low temperature requirement protein LtrA
MTGVAAAPPPAVGAQPEHAQRVTPLELFFDLVFVFAITQVTGLISAHPDGTHVLQGMAILVVLWWAWCGYAWLGNSAASDDGLFRVTLLAAMAAMLIASLAVPHAFGRDALVFGVAYATVRVLHIAAYWLLSRDDAELRLVVGALTRSMLPASTLVVIAGLVHGDLRGVLWAVAIAWDLGALYVFGVEGWRVEAGHLAERFGLIIIIALGESIVALGVGAGDERLDAGIIAGALLGVAIAAALWWAYFDIVAIVAERRFRRAQGRERVLIARDSYTYLHLPMVAGIILFAVGVKKTLAHTSDELATVPAVALYAGVALYFLAHVAFRLRNVHTLNRIRLGAAFLLVALIPVATTVGALTALALVALITVSVVAYERVHFRAARERLRREPA